VTNPLVVAVVVPAVWCLVATGIHWRLKMIAVQERIAEKAVRNQ